MQGERTAPCFGLDLPDGCGVEVTIDGETYLYYYTTNSRGELYEYWYDTDGNLVWARHHSCHYSNSDHTNPHDHPGSKDDDGENTIGPQQVLIQNSLHQEIKTLITAQKKQ